MQVGRNIPMGHRSFENAIDILRGQSLPPVPNPELRDEILAARDQLTKILRELDVTALQAPKVQFVLDRPSTLQERVFDAIMEIVRLEPESKLDKTFRKRLCDDFENISSGRYSIISRFDELAQKGLLERVSQGVYRVTDLGREVYAHRINAGHFSVERKKNPE